MTNPTQVLCFRGAAASIFIEERSNISKMTVHEKSQLFGLMTHRFPMKEWLTAPLIEMSEPEIVPTDDEFKLLAAGRFLASQLKNSNHLA